MSGRKSRKKISIQIKELSGKIDELLRVVTIPSSVNNIIQAVVHSDNSLDLPTGQQDFITNDFVNLFSKNYKGKNITLQVGDRACDIYVLVDKSPSLCLLIFRDKKPLTKSDNEQIKKLVQLADHMCQVVKESEKREIFQNLVENLGDMIFELDENGIFTYANPASLKITGYSEKQLYKMHYLEIVDSGELADTIDFFKDNMKKRAQHMDHQCVIVSKDGKKKISVGLKVQFTYDGDWVKKVSAVARDITDLVEARLDVQESEEKYRLLADNSKDLIALHELNGDYKYLSPSVKELLGYTSDELVGESPYNAVHPEDLIRIFDEPARNNLIRKGVYDQQFRIRTKSGNYIWFETYTKPVNDKKGTLIAFQSFSRDITRQKVNQEKLIHADLRLSQYKEGLKSINEITSNSDLSSEEQIEEALGVCTEFLGMESGILSRVEEDKFIIDFIYSPGESRFHKNQVLDLENTFSHEVFRLEDILALQNIGKTTYQIHPAREIFDIDCYIGVPYYVSGAKRGTLVFLSHEARDLPFDQNETEFVKLLSRWIGDILQQKEYETNLLSDKMILQAFANSAPAAIAMFDEEVRYITASDKWYSDYGLEDEYIIGRSYFEVFPKIGRDWEEIFQRALSGKVEHNDQDLIERENGEIQWIKWEVRPWYKKLDLVGGLIMYTEDITQQKEQQLQLKIAKRKAEQASKAKEQFLSTMSHEIRTPLNAIIGMTDVMLMDEQPPDQLKHLKLLKFSGENLLVLINDILDFNKIEAGKLEFDMVDFNLKSLLEKIHDTMQGMATRKKLEFKLKWDPDIPKYVKGDAVRMNQVITNLINNAIKFTEEGYITLKARLMHKESQMCVIKFEVKDTGIGIPEEKIDTVFQSFEQASANTTRKYGGSGLGLAIVKRILEYMDSTIRVHSTLGHGSTFYFELELPLGQSIGDPVVKETGKIEIRKDLKILVAEDNEANRVLIESLFRKWNIAHEFAFNGKIAVEMSATKEYDLILMDLQMPEMDGYEATRTIRSRNDKYFTNLPIIALTASVMSNVLEKTKEVGMNSYVSKPFDPNNLREVIAKYTNNHEESKEALKTEYLSEVNNSVDADEDFPYLKSLIGNDQDALREIVRTTIESIKKATKGVQEGLDGSDIKKIRSELHILRPNLHNVELGHLTENLKTVTELTPEVSANLSEMVLAIEKALSSERLNIFIQ